MSSRWCSQTSTSERSPPMTSTRRASATAVSHPGDCDPGGAKSHSYARARAAASSGRAGRTVAGIRRGYCRRALPRCARRDRLAVCDLAGVELRQVRGVGEEGVVAGAAVDLVGLALAVAAAIPARDPVVPVAAGDDVVRLAALELVVARAAVDAVEPVASVDPIGAVAAEQH